MIFLDANVLIQARLNQDDLGTACRDLLSCIDDAKVEGISSVLVLDEVIWAVRRGRSYGEAIAYGRDLLQSAIRFEGVGTEDAILALDLMERGLKPRDAIHAAFSMRRGIYTVVTYDADFRKVKELEVLEAAEVLRRVHP